MGAIQDIARKDLEPNQKGKADDEPRKCMAHQGRNFVNGEEDFLHFFKIPKVDFVLKQKQPGMWAAFVGSRQAAGRLGPCQP
jgi:hypothetical protein